MTAENPYQKKPWLASYQNGVPEKITYQQICLPQILEKTAEQFPNQTAFIFQGYKVSFARLKEMVDRFATALSAMGIQKGDAVAIILPNVIPCVVAYYAILRLGGIAVMNNPLYTDHELKHQLNDSGAKVLVTLDLLAPRMCAVRPETGVREIVYCSIGDYLPFPKNILFPLVAKKKGLAATVPPAENLFQFKPLLAQTENNPPEVNLDFEDIAQYQYTGGTTGLSKGAVLTHRNLSSNVQQVVAWFPDLESGAEVMLGALPFFHVFGLTASMNLSIAKGWTNVLVPKPQPDPLMAAVTKFKPTFVPLVPTMFIGLLAHPKLSTTDLSFMKGSFSGSAPLPLEVIREFEEKTGAVIVEAYGLTETSPGATINPFVEGKGKVGSIGVPISDTEICIVDLTDGKTVMPVGEAGELLIRGPQVMQGYHNKPDETAAAIDPEGWFHTGDIATMDEDGYFYIVDRKKDMILSGGYNVYPRDVEEVFFQHPKVMEAAAIGIPHPKRGEAVKVFVVTQPGESVAEDELMAHCEGRLAKYKWPVEIEFLEELPKSNVGKVLKKDLRR